MSTGKYTGIYFPLELYKKIKRLSKKEDRSFGKMCRILISESLIRRSKRKK